MASSCFSCRSIFLFYFVSLKVFLKLLPSSTPSSGLNRVVVGLETRRHPTAYRS